MVLGPKGVNAAGSHEQLPIHRPQTGLAALILWRNLGTFVNVMMTLSSCMTAWGEIPKVKQIKLAIFLLSPPVFLPSRCIPGTPGYSRLPDTNYQIPRCDMACGLRSPLALFPGIPVRYREGKKCSEIWTARAILQGLISNLAPPKPGQLSM